MLLIVLLSTFFLGNAIATLTGARSFLDPPAARKRIEGMANEAGLDVIDEAFFEDAKAKFGQK